MEGLEHPELIIGIGSEKEQLLPTEVLKFSILRHTQKSASFVNLSDINKDAVLSGRTPFSLQRFRLAEIANEVYPGCDLFIYFDSDMLVLDSIDSLVSEFESLDTNIAATAVKKDWGRREQTSVLVFNNAGENKLRFWFLITQERKS